MFSYYEVSRRILQACRRLFIQLHVLGKISTILLPYNFHTLFIKSHPLIIKSSLFDKPLLLPNHCSRASSYQNSIHQPTKYTMTCTLNGMRNRRSVDSQVSPSLQMDFSKGYDFLLSHCVASICVIILLFNQISWCLN